MYIDKHNEMDYRATVVLNFVEHCSSSESIEVGHYLSAIDGLCSMQLGFKDVQMFLFKPKLSVLLNLIGLHYCIRWLGVPVVTPTSISFPLFNSSWFFHSPGTNAYFPESNFPSYALQCF